MEKVAEIAFGISTPFRNQRYCRVPEPVALTVKAAEVSLKTVRETGCELITGASTIVSVALLLVILPPGFDTSTE